MKNIRLIYILKFLRDISFSSAVFNLIIIGRGFSIGDLAIFFTITKVAQILLEIPAGYLVQNFGRAKVLQVSRVLLMIFYLILMFTHSFALLIVAAILDGLTSAMYSDTDTSLIYDTMKKNKKISDYPKFIAKYNMIGLFSYSIASIAGVMVAEKFGLDSTLIFNLPICLLHLILSGYLQEDKKKISPQAKRMFSSPFGMMQHGLQVIIGNKSLIRIVYFSSIIYGFNMIIWGYYQNYGEAINLPLFAFGWIAVAFSMAEGIPQFIAYKYINHKNFSTLFAIITILTSLLGVAGSILANSYGLILLVTAVVITGFSFPISEAIFHFHTPPKYRDTLCAFNSICLTLTYVVMTLIFGGISDRYGIFNAFLTLSLFTFVGGIFYFTMHFNHRKNTAHR